MGLIALVGDCTTTTAVALAAAWPKGDDSIGGDPVIVEFDRNGGSLAAWLDSPSSPSLSTLVAARPAQPGPMQGGSTLHRSDVEAIMRRSPSGVRFVAAPVRAREAARAIEQIEGSLLPILSVEGWPVVLADLGQVSATQPVPSAVSAADITVVVHRQDAASASAASVRVDRLTETVEVLGSTGADLVLAVVGDRPFDVDEIASHVASTAGTPLGGVCSIAVDPLSAMVFAGRAGVSPRRLARLPLARSIGAVADLLAAMLSARMAGAR